MKRSHEAISGRIEDDKSTAEQSQPSSALKEIILNAKVNNCGDVSDFLQNVWQKEPLHFSPSSGKSKPNDQSSIDEGNALQGALGMKWDGEIASLLQKSRYLLRNLNEPTQEDDNDDDSSSDDDDNNNKSEAIPPQLIPPPLFFRDQQALQLDELQETYNFNPYAAYLDGCSIVINHADALSTPLSRLADDLQKTFPHVYINTYLTPPKSKAVKAHADDRDVFVLQIKGKKYWKVYKKVPIQFPYPEEQVGKSPTLPVPDDVLEGPTYFEGFLKEGDVLYMPRGYVHEAMTSADDDDDCNDVQDPSFHATIAISTQDWSLSKTLSDLIRKKLDDVVDCRKSLAPWSSGNKDETSNRITEAMGKIKDCINAESVQKELKAKCKVHNERAVWTRTKLTNLEQQYESQPGLDREYENQIGLKAAAQVRLGSKVQASTPELREKLPSSKTGVYIRDETRTFLFSLLAKLKLKTGTSYKLMDLMDLHKEDEEDEEDRQLICPMTLLSFVKCCIEVGAMSVDSLE